MPRGAVLNDVADVARLEGALEPPVVVKGQFYEATVARTLAEVEGAFLRLQAKWGVPVIVQEFVSGGEFDVAAVTGEGGALVGAVAMRKMQLTAQGKAWGGVTIADPAIDAFCRDVLERIEWTGPCELEVIRDPHDGRLTLMEINPRFPAWIYLSVGAGRNLPWAAVRLALGEDVAPLPPALPGVMFLRHSSDEVCALEDYEQLTTAGELIRDRGTS